MAKVSNEKKLDAVKKWLTANNIKFEENHVTKSSLKVDVWIPSLCIAVHVSDNSDDEFYNKTKKWRKPFFIRESETKAFVLEKIQNCCYDQMMTMQKQWEKKNKENQ